MPRPKRIDEPAKQFDVSKPGSAKPSASSRPIIVSSGPIMKDPMVNTADNTASDKPGAPALDTPTKRMDKLMQPSKARITVQPPGTVKADKPATLPDDPKEGKSLDELAAKVESKQAKAVKADKQADDNSVKVTVKRNPKPEPDSKEIAKEKTAEIDNTISPEPPEAIETANDNPEEEPKKSDSATAEISDEEPDDSKPVADDDNQVVDAVAKQVAKKDDAATQQEQIYQDKVSELIASRQYFVPVGHLRRRRHARNFLIALVIVLFALAIGANFAMDAEQLKIDGIEPLTNILK